MITSARKRKQQKKKLVATLLVFLGVFLVSGLVWLRYGVATSNVLHPETLCPQEGPSAFTVLLIDGTDSFSPIQRADIQRNLSAFAKELAIGEQLTVFAPTEMNDDSFLNPVFRKCNPGTNASVSGVTQNPRQIQLRYERGFRDSLGETLQAGLATTEKSTSPIMGMIQAAVIKGFPAGMEEKPKKLVVVSDMLENTTDYTQYRESLDFDAITGRAFFAHLNANLERAEVEVLYVIRDGAEGIQTRRHVLFWENYFRYMNSELVRVIRIGG